MSMCRKLIRRKEVCKLTALSPSTIDRQVKAEVFPIPIQLTPAGSVAWFEDEIADWIESRQPVTATTQRQVAPGSAKRGRPRLNKSNGGAA